MRCFTYRFRSLFDTQTPPATGLSATRRQVPSDAELQAEVADQEPEVDIDEDTDEGDPLLEEEEDDVDTEAASDSELPSGKKAKVWTEDWAKENAERLSHLSPHQPLWVARKQRCQQKQARIVSLCQMACC